MALERKSDQYEFLPEYAVRRPVFPIKYFKEERLKNSVFKLIEGNKSFYEAIFISSPSLYEEIEKLTLGKIKLQENQSIETSIFKYWTRMSTRSTPFGLFSGCGTGLWGEKTDINFISKTRITRLDIDVVRNIAIILSSYSKIKYQIKFFANDTNYILGQNLRYLDPSTQGSNMKYNICSVSVNEFLLEVLRKAENGAMLIDLVDLLVSKGINPNDAALYIEELVQENILISELEPNVYSIDHLQLIVQKLNLLINNKEGLKEIEEITKQLQNIHDSIKNIDSSFENKISSYREIIDGLNKFVKPDFKGITFQTDTFFTGQTCSLNKSIQNSLIDVFSFLNKIYPAETNSKLNNFISKYQSRYEDAEIPLLIALDEENGIGYLENSSENSIDLLDGISPNEGLNNAKNFSLNPASEIICHEIMRCLNSKNYSIRLSDNLFKNINHSTSEIPFMLYGCFSVIDDQDKIYLNHFGQGVDLIGRFSYGSESLKNIAQKVVTNEENFENNCLIADIGFLPEGRAGNISIHEELRKYKIPIFGNLSGGHDNQIKLSELNIKIKEGKIFLINKKNNCVVFPKLSSAHNFSNSPLPVYQFLCDLQKSYHLKNTFRFKGEVFYSLFIFTPRIEYKNVILSRATWNLKKLDCSELLDESLDVISRSSKWKKRWDIPEIIVLIEGDNELCLDLSQEISIKTLINIIKKRDSILFTEFLFNYNNANESHYTNEIICYFQNNNATKSITNFNTTSKNNSIIKQHHTVGDEWLYYKIYCGVKNADKILLQYIYPLINDLLACDLITCWFYIRYTDPENHLRFRVKLNDTQKIGDVILRIKEKFKAPLEIGMVHKILIDNYIRELDRYGNSTINEIESLFQVDSFKSIELINLSKTDRSKWLYSIKGIDDLFNILGMKNSDKKAFSLSMYNSYFKEHKGDKRLKRQLDLKFRKERNAIENLIFNDSIIDTNSQELLLTIKSKKYEVEKIIDSLRNVESNWNDFTINFHKRVSSIIHMMINRVFPFKQRTIEMVLYYLLYKLYKSEQAKISNKTNSNLIKNEGKL